MIGIAAWVHFRGGHAAGHDHDDHRSAVLSLDNGKRWATDAPLRTGMERIRDATNAFIAARTTSGVEGDAATSLANTINETVSYLVENCRLSPKADAALHVLITDLISGAAKLSLHPESAEGLDEISHALHLYPEYFDHPQWKPLAPAGT